MQYSFPIITRGIPPRGSREQNVCIIRTIEVDLPELSEDQAPIAMILREGDRYDEPEVTCRYYEGRLYKKCGKSVTDFMHSASQYPMIKNGPRAEIFEEIRLTTDDRNLWPRNFHSEILSPLAKPCLAQQRLNELSRVRLADDEGLGDRFVQLALKGLSRYQFINGEVWEEIEEPVFAVFIGDDSDGDDVDFCFSFGNHTFGRTLDEGVHYFSLTERQAAIALAGELFEEHFPGHLDNIFPSADIFMPEVIAKDGNRITLLALASKVAATTDPPDNPMRKTVIRGSIVTLSELVSMAEDGRAAPEDVETALYSHISACRLIGANIAVSESMIQSVLSRWDGRPVSFEVASAPKP
jgi:hypothetical protein